MLLLVQEGLVKWIKDRKLKIVSLTLSLDDWYSRANFKHEHDQEEKQHAFLSAQVHCILHSYLHGRVIIALLCLFLKSKSSPFFRPVSHENGVMVGGQHMALSFSFYPKRIQDMLEI